jgi:hypothetical protein
MAVRILAVLVVILGTAVVALLMREPEYGGTRGAVERIESEADTGGPGEGLPAAPATPTRTQVGDSSPEPRAPVSEELAGSADDEPEPEPDDGNDLVDYYLGDGVMERRLVVDKRLRELTEKPFADLWARGIIYNVSDMGSRPFRSEDGRPRPCEVRLVDGLETMVYLPEEEYPEVWALMELREEILKEMSDLNASMNGPPTHSGPR